MDPQRPKRPTSARERQMARKRRRQERTNRKPVPMPSVPNVKSIDTQNLRQHANDWLWYVRRNPLVWRGAIAAAVIIGVLFLISYSVSGRIYPAVSSMGVSLGNQSTERAAANLESSFREMYITVIADGEQVGRLRPSDIGLRFDAEATAQLAREVGPRQGILGETVSPVASLPDDGYLKLQDYLLSLSDQINQPPSNAGFQWRGGDLVAVAGEAGRLVDIAPTLAFVTEQPERVLESRELVVQVSPLEPDVFDAEQYLDTARAFTEEDFVIQGYDPFTDTTIAWTSDRDTVTSWLEIGPEGLTLREETFAPFIDAQNEALAAQYPDRPLYINTQEMLDAMRDALVAAESSTLVRVRYRPQPYTIVSGDTANAIARKTGIPFYLVQQNNPGRDLDIISPGDQLNMPTRDLTMPHTPIANKRVIVDLESQELWAYENGEMIFNWQISSGTDLAPTSPGIFQILSHSDKAFGSSFSLCDDMGCGQWEMDWFMGVYEVVPGLMNGFHGAVLLPNGAYLNGGSTGFPSTFGCIMSSNDEAALLYEWAELGTVVEIISDEFEPMSALGEQTKLNIQAREMRDQIAKIDKSVVQM